MTYVMPSTHIKDVLVANGYYFGRNPAQPWEVYIGKQPGNPDRVITIYDAPGKSPDPKWLLDFPSVQVRVRGGQPDYNVAAIKAKELQGLLIGRESFDGLNGDRIVSILGLGDVGFTGWDDQTRPEFVFNLNMIIEPSAASTPTQREALPG